MAEYVVTGFGGTVANDEGALLFPPDGEGVVTTGKSLLGIKVFINALKASTDRSSR